MRITVIRPIVSDICEETREIYEFNLFDLDLVFVLFRLETKAFKKRKWRIKSIWDKYGKESNNTIEEPKLPSFVIEQALSIARLQLKVKTWKEFKNCSE